MSVNRYHRTSGVRWAFLQRHDIPDLLNPSRIYLSRWRIIQTPWFGVYVHAIRLPDGDRHLHDHPWPFATLILRGGYVEEWAGHESWARFADPEVRVWMPGTLHRMRRGEFHRVRTLLGRTVTLVFVGPRTGTWGYATPAEFVEHERYHASRNRAVFGGDA